MALPACAYGGRKTSYLHDTHHTTSQLTVPSSEVEIEVALHCGAGQHAWQWWEVTEFCHGRCEEFWQSPRVERGSAGEKEAVRKTRKSCKLGGREGCCWSTSDGSPWRSAACWVLSSGRGENSDGCVQQENWKNWNTEMYSEGSYCLKRQKMLQHIALISVKTVKCNIRSQPKVWWSGAGLRQGVEGPGDRLCVGEPGRLSVEETECWRPEEKLRLVCITVLPFDSFFKIPRRLWNSKLM